MDLYSLGWCNGRVVTLQRDRSGYVESILVSSSPVSSEFGVYPSPVDEPKAIACSDSALYVATDDGLALEVPIAQVAGP